MTEECICVIEGQYEGCPVHDTKKEALTSKESTLVERLDRILCDPYVANRAMARTIREARDVLSANPSAPETKKDDARDAERYRYLRERQAWDRLAARKIVITTEGGREPYRTLREAELDREIDECIGVPPAQETPREPGPMCSVCDHIEEMHKSMGASHPFTPKASENPLDDAGLPVCVNNPSLHSWSVRGRLGNPLPEQLCENGCGLMWKNRDSDQNGPANPAK